jgi:hypothetical protein
MKNETITITKTITGELDPCVAPKGCPELEPWMAYVGIGDYYNNLAKGRTELYYCDFEEDEWSQNLCDSEGIYFPDSHYAVDVRTAWAQEHFDEHVRIRNYQEPDAFEEFIKNEGIICGACMEHSLARRAYELGQQNPTK